MKVKKVVYKKIPKKEGAWGIAWHDKKNELEVIKSAMGKVKGLKGYLLERKQNCLHVDCQ